MTSQALASRPMENKIMADHVYASMYAFMDAHHAEAKLFLGKLSTWIFISFYTCLELKVKSGEDTKMASPLGVPPPQVFSARRKKDLCTLYMMKPFTR